MSSIENENLAEQRATLELLRASVKPQPMTPEAYDATLEGIVTVAELLGISNDETAMMEKGADELLRQERDEDAITVLEYLADIHRFNPTYAIKLGSLALERDDNEQA